MKLMELLRNCPVRNIHGNKDIDLHGLHYDSRKVERDDAFFALRGVVSDGHDYIASAIANGARVLFCEEQPKQAEAVTTVLVDNARQAMALGVDCLIVADIGVMEHVRSRSADFPIHLSVQASATNLRALEFYHRNFAIRRAPALGTQPEVYYIV